MPFFLVSVRSDFDQSEEFLSTDQSDSLRHTLEYKLICTRQNTAKCQFSLLLVPNKPFEDAIRDGGWVPDTSNVHATFVEETSTQVPNCFVNGWQSSRSPYSHCQCFCFQIQVKYFLDTFIQNICLDGIFV